MIIKGADGYGEIRLRTGICKGLEGQYRVVASDISKAKVTIPAQIYTGKEITLDKNQITVKIGKDILAPENYEIVTDSYENNVRKGTANVTIKGVGCKHIFRLWYLLI